MEDFAYMHYRTTATMIYFIAIAAMAFVALRVRKGPSYLPIVRWFGGAMTFRGVQYIAIVLLSRIYPDLLRDPVQVMTSAVVVGVVCCWCAYLTWKINTLPPSRSVDMLGRVTIEDRVYAEYHLDAAARLSEHNVINKGEWVPKLREAYEHRRRSGETSFTIDVNGCIAAAVGGPRVLLGFSPAELRGMPIRELITVDTRQSATKVFEYVMANRPSLGGKVIKGLKLYNKDREEVEVDVIIVRIKPSDDMLLTATVTKKGYKGNLDGVLASNL